MAFTTRSKAAQENIKAIMLALYFLPGWTTAGMVADVLGKNPSGVGATMRHMHIDGWLERKWIIAPSKNGPPEKRQAFLLSSKARAECRRLMNK